MSDSAQVQAGTSSIEVNKNAKGELAYKVKVYAGVTQGEMDELVTIARDTLTSAEIAFTPKA